MNQEIPVSKSNAVSAASFGKQPTDHMFISEYKNGSWSQGKLVPFQNITLSPFALCFHYGQTVFEGMKVFRTNDGHINIFCPDMHWERFNNSLIRMCMPEVSRELFLGAIEKV